MLGDSGQNSGNQNAERNVDLEDQKKRVSTGNKDPTGNWSNIYHTLVEVFLHFFHVLSLYNRQR